MKHRLSRVTAALLSGAMLCGAVPYLSASADDTIFHSSFESGTDGWKGRGAATAEIISGSFVAGQQSLACSGRTSSWNGVAKELSTDDFVPGTAYSFSVYVMPRSSSTEEVKLTLEYSDGSTAHYDNVATASGSAEWVHLSNMNYTIPSDATSLILYVETTESTVDFYIDEAAAAPAGTALSSETTMPQGIRSIPGDVNADDRVNAFDLVGMRSILTGSANGFDTLAADIDEDGEVQMNDAVQLAEFLSGKIKTFTVVERPQPPTQPPTEPPTTPPPSAENKWDTYQETASSQNIDFYKSAIKHMGNTYRLDKKLEGAENGDPLTIAYLGGSITEGKNYTTPFSKYVQQTFAKGSFKEVNAGLSGTSSVVGLVRSEQEIVSQNPDIIFLEFSVNDHEDIMYKKCFESCIKKFLDLPNEPAVIVLITRAKGGFSSQAQMYPIGKNFDIPVISMDDALTKAFNSGFLSPNDYYTDEYHPHQKGGQLIADCLGYFFRQAMKSENRSSSYELPSKAVYGMEYANCVGVNPKDLDSFNAGSWSSGMGYNGNKALNYSYSINGGGNPMTFKTEGKGLIIVFKANASGMGSINVTVNGKTTKVNGNKQYTWGGPDAELGYYQDTTGPMDVSISGSGSFTIWDIGLIK